MDADMRALMEPLNVRCIDAFEIRRRHPARILNGWELKPFAIIHSAFHEALMLDADNVPVVEPSFLFETPEYLRHRAVFWPDYGRLGPERSIWQLTGVPYRDEPEFETGQILVDKRVCWQALRLTMWMNEHSDFWYQHIYGDKETFHMAWRKLELAYAMPSRGIESLADTMCQHDFNGRRIFQHRNCAKWSLDHGNQMIPGFVDEDLCLGHLADLRRLWARRPTRSFDYHVADEDERVIADNLCIGRWVMEESTNERYSIRFGLDGRIVQDASASDIRWNLERDGATVLLRFVEAEGATCKLVQLDDNHWKGRRQPGNCGQLLLSR